VHRTLLKTIQNASKLIILVQSDEVRSLVWCERDPSTDCSRINTSPIIEKFAFDFMGKRWVYGK